MDIPKDGWKPLIYEWTPEGSFHSGPPTTVRNFGDALIDVLYEDLFLDTLYKNPKNVYFLLGSVICNETIEQTLRLDCEPIFSECGARGERLDPDLLKVSKILKVRGPLSKNIIEISGVEVESSIDPGYRVKDKVAPGKPHGASILIPHMLDPDKYEYLASGFGVNWVRQTDVYIKQQTIGLIKDITGARFVLTGSLHAAIIAHAYGIPFAPFATNYVDCSFKWSDWALSVGINYIQFFDNVNDGREWWRNNVPKFV